MSSTSLHNLLYKFMNEYADELVDARKNENFRRPFGSIVRKEIVDEIFDIVADKLYYVKGSVGAGRWTDVPWIAVFDTRITKTAQKGVYIVYLLNKDTKKLYLTFNQGATDVAQDGVSQDGKLTFTGIASTRENKVLDKLKKQAELIREELKISIGIEVNKPDTGSQAYDAGCICYKVYSLESLPDDGMLKKDLLTFLDIYKQYYVLSQKDNNEWWPSIEEYDPGISREKWLELLNDTEVFTPHSLSILAAFYKTGGISTCTVLDKQYERTKGSFRSVCTQIAKRVHRKVNCPLYTDENRTRYYTILFVGHKADRDEDGSYVWKLRTELFEALERFDILKYSWKEDEIVPKTAKEKISQIKSYIANQGFCYNDNLIENFYLSLKSKPFVILAGTSGTGKTRLVRLFAEAIGANLESDGGNGRYKLVSVRPDWSDSSDLFGHVNLKGEFVSGAIIDFVKRASLDSANPYFLCLDEMNLARVEYYLSDFLSVIETRHRAGDEIVTDEIMLDKSAEKKYGKVILPENLYIIGTVNMDETTFPFSKKVLDRANTIEFSYVDLVPNFSKVMGNSSVLLLKNDFLKAEYITLIADIPEPFFGFVTDICKELQDINQILQKAQSHVGYRVRDEIVFYLVNNQKFGLMSKDEAMDNEIMQKILPRIQGSSLLMKDMLKELFKKFAGDYSGISQTSISQQMQEYLDNKDCKYRKSAEKICYMMRRFEEDGFTSYWL